MNHQEAMKSVSHLMRREIQAPIAAALIRDFAEKLGLDEALAIAGKTVEKDAMAAGKDLAAQYGGNSLQVLARIIRELWAAGGTMKIDFLKETEDELCFDVTYCGYAEMYERLGIMDLGCTLSCCRDFAILGGFNPDIVLIRSQTLMEGHTCCDFRYQVKGA